MDPTEKFEQSDVDTSWIDVHTTIEKLTQGIGFQYSKRSGPAVQQILDTWHLDSLTANQTWTLPLGRPSLPPSTVPDATRSVAPPILGKEQLHWTYGSLTAEKATEWLETLGQKTRDSQPTEEQSQFLRPVIDRCLAESIEETSEPPQRSEPWRAIFHGVPGAGKSQTLKWLRQFFEGICTWKHQQEFVYLAPQNTQAALIEGMAFAFLCQHSHQSQRGQQGTNARARPVRAIPTTSLDGPRRMFDNRFGSLSDCRKTIAASNTSEGHLEIEPAR